MHYRSVQLSYLHCLQRTWSQWPYVLNCIRVCGFFFRRTFALNGWCVLYSATIVRSVLLVSVRLNSRIAFSLFLTESPRGACVSDVSVGGLALLIGSLHWQRACVTLVTWRSSDSVSTTVCSLLQPAWAQASCKIWGEEVVVSVQFVHARRKPRQKRHRTSTALSHMRHKYIVGVLSFLMNATRRNSKVSFLSCR